jgi:rod shape-determining protein MreD
MKVFAVLLLSVFAFAIEPIVGSQITSDTLRPNVVLIPLVVGFLAWPGPFAVVWAGIVGLVCDCLAGTSVGPQMAAFALVAGVGTLMFPKDRPLSAFEIVLVCFGFLFSAEIASSLIRMSTEGRTVEAVFATRVAARSAATTTVLIGGFWLAGRALAYRLTGWRPMPPDVSIGWQKSAD